MAVVPGTAGQPTAGDDVAQRHLLQVFDFQIGFAALQDVDIGLRPDQAEELQADVGIVVEVVPDLGRQAAVGVDVEQLGHLLVGVTGVRRLGARGDPGPEGVDDDVAVGAADGERSQGLQVVGLEANLFSAFTDRGFGGQLTGFQMAAGADELAGVPAAPHEQMSVGIERGYAASFLHGYTQDCPMDLAGLILAEMTPTARAIAMAAEKIEYVLEDDGHHILKVFGTRYRYDDAVSALQAKERLITLLAEVMEEYAAEVQALNSWLPTPTTQN